jgi:hypothetical protein
MEHLHPRLMVGLAPHAGIGFVVVDTVAVDANLNAFRRGRQAVCAPDELATALENVRPSPVVRETPQSIGLLDDFRADPDSELAQGVAKRAHADIRDRFGPGAKYAHKLHPPVLRTLGMKKKISLGRWSRPVFRSWHTLRRLRGTRTDLFGYARLRRIERDLVTEYRLVVEEVIAQLSPETHQVSTEIAALPDMVRGYEQIKLDNIASYRQRLAELRAGPAAPSPSSTR